MPIKTQSLLLAQKRISVEKTRPANTTAYTADDVVSESDSAGTAWTFDAVAPTNGGGGFITGAFIITDDTAITAQFSLYLFDATPGGNLNDNAANTEPLYATDDDNFIGVIDFQAMRDDGTGASWAVATPSTDGNVPIPYVCATADDALYGVLVDQSGHTPTSGQKYRITLTVAPD